MPGKKRPLSYVRVMCPDCYFVLDESVVPLIGDPCPHCGSRDDVRFLVGFGHIHIYDMIEYFNHHGITVNEGSVAQISSTLQKQLGLTIDREGLIQTVQAVKEMYERLDPTGEESEYFYDDAIYIVQDILALPTYQHADKAWQIIGHYSVMTYDHKMVVILVNMLLEQLLDERLIVLAITQDGLDQAHAETQIYNTLQNMHKKRKFFLDHLPHISSIAHSNKVPVNAAFEAAFATCAPTDFCSDWGAIRQIRNRFIHQNEWAIELADVQRALRLAHHAIPVFAEVQNRYCLKDPTSA